jgi:uncharacterized membrane protein YphA (DoxX/SURF4 family)
MNVTLSHHKNQKETAVITTTARVTEARPRRLTSTMLWAAQILLAAFFLFVAAGPKLAGSHSSVQEFGLIGAGQWFRYFVGTLELAGAIGLLTPWLAGLAAAGLAADMAGATIINATVLHNTTYGPNVWMTAIARLARFVLAHRRLVVLVWVLLLPAGIYGASHVSNRLSTDFSLPGQPGYETAKKITHLYGNGGDTSPTVVLVTLPRGLTVARDDRQLGRAFDQARAADPSNRVVDYSATRDPRFILPGGHSTFALVFTPAGKGFGSVVDPDAVVSTLSGTLPPGTLVGSTGLDQLANGGSSNGPGVLVETLIGAVGALAVLAFVFGSLLAFVPLVIAASSILTTLLVVLGVTMFANV